MVTYIYSSNVESDSAVQNFLIKGDCSRIKNFIVPTYILGNKEKGEIQIDSLLDPNDYIVTKKYIFDISFGKSFDSILDSILPQTFSADDVYKYSLKSTLKTQNEKMHFYTQKNLPDEYKSKIPEDSLNNVDRSYNKIQSWLKSLEEKE